MQYSFYIHNVAFFLNSNMFSQDRIMGKVMLFTIKSLQEFYILRYKVVSQHSLWIFIMFFSRYSFNKIIYIYHFYLSYTKTRPCHL